MQLRIPALLVSVLFNQSKKTFEGFTTALIFGIGLNVAPDVVKFSKKSWSNIFSKKQKPVLNPELVQNTPNSVTSEHIQGLVELSTPPLTEKKKNYEINAMNIFNKQEKETISEEQYEKELEIRNVTRMILNLYHEGSLSKSHVKFILHAQYKFPLEIVDMCFLDFTAKEVSLLFHLFSLYCEKKMSLKQVNFFCTNVLKINFSFDFLEQE